MLYPVISNVMNSSKAGVVINDYSSEVASNTVNKNEFLIEEARNYKGFNYNNYLSYLLKNPVIYDRIYILLN